MRVELNDISLELRQSVMTGRGTITQRDGILVQVVDRGISGWGEALPLPGWPGAELSATRRALEAWAANPDPENLPLENFARGAVGLALLDLEAQRVGRTQAEVLAAGRSMADSVELNALVGDADEAALAVADGFRTVKLKVGGRDPKDDIEAVTAVRDAIGDAVRLRLDANGAWGVDQALAALSQLEQFDIEYVEEPTSGLEALDQVAQLSPISVAVDDSLGSAETQVPESISVVVVKPMVLGGPRTAHAAACRWIDQGRKVIVTNYLDSAIGQHGALSVAAALPGPPEVHGAITAALFTGDLANLPPILSGRCRVPPQSPVPVGFGLNR